MRGILRFVKLLIALLLPGSTSNKFVANSESIPIVSHSFSAKLGRPFWKSASHSAPTAGFGVGGWWRRSGGGSLSFRTPRVPRFLKAPPAAGDLHAFTRSSVAVCVMGAGRLHVASTMDGRENKPTSCCRRLDERVSQSLSTTDISTRSTSFVVMYPF